MTDSKVSTVISNDDHSVISSDDHSVISSERSESRNLYKLFRPVLIWVLHEHRVVVLHISGNFYSEPLRLYESLVL